MSRLDRNVKGRNKYALVKLRLLDEDNTTLSRHEKAVVDAALQLLSRMGVVEYGDGSRDFFVIKLQDKFAGEALAAYGKAALKDDPQYARDVLNLSLEAEKNPNRKMPD